VLLATNLSGHIDPAFTCLIVVAVTFQLPNVDERLEIWRLEFPDARGSDGAGND